MSMFPIQLNMFTRYRLSLLVLVVPFIIIVCFPVKSVLLATIKTSPDQHPLHVWVALLEHLHRLAIAHLVYLVQLAVINPR